LFNLFPKESHDKNYFWSRGFWHLTLCTLLSSQGSGAPKSLSFESDFGATALTYHLLRRGQNHHSAPFGTGRKSCRISHVGLAILPRQNKALQEVLCLSAGMLSPLEAGEQIRSSAPLG
jgi:hypothetical protein